MTKTVLDSLSLSQEGLDPPSLTSRFAKPFLTSKSPLSFIKLMTSVGIRYLILNSFFKKSRIFVLDTYDLSASMEPVSSIELTSFMMG